MLKWQRSTEDELNVESAMLYDKIFRLIHKKILTYKDTKLQFIQISSLPIHSWIFCESFTRQTMFPCECEIYLLYNFPSVRFTQFSPVIQLYECQHNLHTFSFYILSTCFIILSNFNFEKERFRKRSLFLQLWINTFLMQSGVVYLLKRK